MLRIQLIYTLKVCVKILQNYMLMNLNASIHIQVFTYHAVHSDNVQ